jgi:hypothetical protein
MDRHGGARLVPSAVEGRRIAVRNLVALKIADPRDVPKVVDSAVATAEVALEEAALETADLGLGRPVDP